MQFAAARRGSHINRLLMTWLFTNDANPDAPPLLKTCFIFILMPLLCLEQGIINFYSLLKTDFAGWLSVLNSTYSTGDRKNASPAVVPFCSRWASQGALA